MRSALRLLVTRLPVVFVLAAGLCPGPAQAFDFFVAHEPVYAVVGEELFTGEAHARLDRSGKLTVQSTRNAALHCDGTFHFIRASAGEVSLQCSDGIALQLAFEALGLASGHGRGNTPRGPVRFTFGLSPDKASAYLELPKGKRLTKTAKGVQLQDG